MIEDVERVKGQRQLARLLALRFCQRYVMRPMHVYGGEAGGPQRIAADANRTRIGHPGVKEIDPGGLGVWKTRREAAGDAEVAPTSGGERAEDVEPMADVEIGRTPL